jgi:hypothetical protein
MRLIIFLFTFSSFKKGVRPRASTLKELKTIDKKTLTI